MVDFTFALMPKLRLYEANKRGLKVLQPIKVSQKYHVSPQIEIEDIKKLVDAGFTKIICNRPNEEIPAELHSNYMAIAAKAAGISFDILPLTHQAMTPENIAKQAELIDAASGPVLAYCASGTRCTVIWALGQTGKMSADDIIHTASEAGYNIEGLRQALS